MSKSNPEKSRRLAIIASKGTLDWAYPPFILGSAAAAMGWEVGIFFTFYGLTLLRPNIEAQVSPLGNPAMPMKMPFGSDGFQAIEWPIPTAMMTVPGFNALATGLMKKTFANKGVAAVSELRDTCVALGVRMIGCQMTMDVFGFEKEEFIPEAEIGGAAAFLEFAADADVTLFV
ncbi:MAG: NADH dehydrogenase [Chloroflexi bacterium RBG_13_66_10]|nr:MAG: NADH dehydrogenase [Chloroflexi bacterium RBG_13_66_10]